MLLLLFTTEAGGGAPTVTRVVSVPTIPSIPTV